MENPLRVSLDNIIPLTEARDHFSQIVSEVQKDKLYVLTKGGKPAVAIIAVKYLERITGGEVKKEHIVEEIKKAPEKVGLPPMVEHSAPKPASPIPSPVVPPQHTPPPVTPPAQPFAPTPTLSKPGILQTPSEPKEMEVPIKKDVPQTVNVQMMTDGDDIAKSEEKKTVDDLTAPDDKPGPAQFSGQDQQPQQQKDPHDMEID